MPLNRKQEEEIRNLLRTKLNDKLSKYVRETTSMPFLVKLMQDSEKVASYSFIHSLATTLGMSVYEKIAEIVASTKYDEVKTGYDVEGEITNEENSVISQILQEIKNGTRTANKEQEIKEILKVKNNSGRKIKIRADLFLRKGNDEYYIEIKTAKPNIDVFVKSKQKLLEWVALRKKKVNTILAIPYNPYHPEPYSRFTMQGYLDEEKELYVAGKLKAMGYKVYDLDGGMNAWKESGRGIDEK